MFKGPILCAIALKFKGHIMQTLNLDLMLYFVNDYFKALSTRVTKIILSGFT
jgi:hypothetical protein